MTAGLFIGQVPAGLDWRLERDWAASKDHWRAFVHLVWLLNMALEYAARDPTTWRLLLKGARRYSTGYFFEVRREGRHEGRHRNLRARGMRRYALRPVSMTASSHDEAMSQACSALMASSSLSRCGSAAAPLPINGFPKCTPLRLPTKNVICLSRNCVGTIAPHLYCRQLKLAKGMRYHIPGLPIAGTISACTTRLH